MKKISWVIFLVGLGMSSGAAADDKKDIVHQDFGGVAFKQTLYSGNVTNYADLPTQIAKKYGSFSYESLPLDRQTAQLVRLWTSIKNKCSYCTIFHTQEARDAGIDIHKIDNIVAYRESELFSDKEKAALDYAAAISNVDYDRMPAATKQVRKYFKDEEVETIIMCTLLMDVWSRMFAVKGNVPYYTDAAAGSKP